VSPSGHGDASTPGDAGPDGRLKETLRALVVRPGSLTRAVREGTGSRYFPLGGLLLAFAAVYLALVFVQTRGASGPPDDIAGLCTDGGGQGADLQTLIGAAGASGDNVQVSPSATRVLNFASHSLCDPAPMMRAFAFAIPIAFLLLIPVFAWLMQLAFRAQMPGFNGNWIYAVESHAALFLLLTALAVESFLGSFVLGFLCSVGGLVYTSWNLTAGVQLAYGVSARAARWKTTLVGVIYAVCLVIAVGLLMWVQLAG